MAIEITRHYKVKRGEKVMPERTATPPAFARCVRQRMTLTLMAKSYRDLSCLNSDSNDDQRDSTLTRLISLIFTADSTLTPLI